MVIKSIKYFRDLKKLQSLWEGWQYHPNTDFAHYQLVCKLRRHSPYVMIAQNGGSPRALVAARLEHSRFTPSVGYFKLGGIPLKALHILHHGLLGHSDEYVCSLIISHIWSLLSSGEIDAAFFHHLPNESPLLLALRRCAPRFWCSYPTGRDHWEMTLPNETGFILKNMSSKHRSWIRGRKKKLNSDFPGKVAWRWLRPHEDINTICSRIEEVASRTYQRGLGAGFKNDEEHRERYSLFARRGQLRIQLLEIGDKVGAFWIGMLYDGIFHSSATGYDPDLRSYELGTLMLINMADELVREGVKSFDFGLGDAAYKKRFGDHRWQETSPSLFAPSFKGFVLCATSSGTNILNKYAQQFLTKTGALDKVKTNFRRSVQKKTSS